MKNDLGALMLWIDRKLNKNHDALATKIDAIQNLFETSSEASATAADILEGKTAYNGTTLITGTMVNQESREATLLAGGSYNIPRGFHDGTGRVMATNLDDQTPGTATASGILSGLKAWVAGKRIDGTMKDRRGITVTAGVVTQDDEYTYLSIPEEACYDANSKVRTPNSNISNLQRYKIVDGTANRGDTVNLGNRVIAVVASSNAPDQWLVGQGVTYATFCDSIVVGVASGSYGLQIDGTNIIFNQYGNMPTVHFKALVVI